MIINSFKLLNIMKDFSNLTLENLERTSKNWDKRTKDLILDIGGSGNMFGGSAKYLHITLLGENAGGEYSNRVGEILLKGLIKSGYNIARGANGDTTAFASYYKNYVDFKSIGYDTKPTYEVEIKNSCTGHIEALSAILSAPVDFII